MISGIVALALRCLWSLQTSTTMGEIGHAPPPRLIGPETKRIAADSPILRFTISLVVPGNRGEYKAWIRYEVENQSGALIDLSGVGPVYEVRKIGDLKKVEETPAGCAANFFSVCHTTPLPSVNVGRQERILKPSEKVAGNVPLDILYIFVKGKYAVTGFFCSRADPATDCIRSNEIVVEVQ